MESFILGWGGKMLLGIVLPLITAFMKVVIDKWTPIVLDKVPRLVWPTLLGMLSTAATTISPEAFLLPGFPAWVSAALYPLVAMGIREIYDQARKATAGNLTPADAAQTPPGI